MPAIQIICDFLGLLLLLDAFTILLSAFLSFRIDPRQDPPLVGLENHPLVTIQLPVYNEEHVIGRLLQAVGQLNYPKDRLEIQILDDSNDRTCQIIDQHTALLRERGWSVTVYRRAERKFYKAGALAETLDRVGGEYLCVFDADFVPAPDYLQQMLPYLEARPELAFVQARWTHLNEQQNQVTRLQALFLDMHFIVQKPVEQKAGLFINYNGTGAVWRKQAVVACGGWALEALSEDMDISYRAQLQGWKALYLPGVTVPGELPASLSVFARQQERWAFGAIQFLRKFWYEILKSRVSFANRVHALFVPSGYMMSVLMVLLLVLPIPLLAAAQKPLLPAVGFFSLVAAQAVLAVAAQARLHPQGRGRIQPVLLLLCVIIGLAPRLSRGVLKGLFKIPYRFDRTPKEGTAVVPARKAPAPAADREAQRMSMIEILFVLLALAGGILAFVHSAWLLLAMYLLCGLCIFGVNRVVRGDVK